MTRPAGATARARAVIKLLLPRVEGEGLREGDTIRWASPPFAATLRTTPPFRRFELRMGHLKLVASWSGGEAPSVLLCAHDDWWRLLLDEP
jgi:hypothetical protein